MRIRAILVSTTAAALLALPLGAPAALSSPAPAAAAKAGKFDKYCKSQSRKRRSGSVSNFALCVRAMRRLDRGSAKTARSACKSLSKKASGRRSSPYRLCLRGASRLRADKQKSDESYADPFGN
jgi:hypothetical protein